MIPKWSKNQFEIYLKNDAGEHRKILTKIRQTFRLWLPFWSQLLGSFVRWRILIATWFSKNSRGAPLDQFWPTLRHPWSDFLDFLEDSRSIFAQKIQRFQSAPTTPSKKQARIQNNLTEHQAEQIMFYLCCLTKPHKSEAPGLRI